MPIIQIPPLFRYYTDGQAEVPVEGATVSACMDSLVANHPAIQTHLYKSDGELRAFVNLFVNKENIKKLRGLETLLDESDILRLVPAITGG